MKFNLSANFYLLMTTVIVLTNCLNLMEQTVGVRTPMTTFNTFFFTDINTLKIALLSVISISAFSLVFSETVNRKETKASLWLIFLNFVGVTLVAPLPVLAGIFSDGLGDNGRDILIWIILWVCLLVYVPLGFIALFRRFRAIRNS